MINYWKCCYDAVRWVFWWCFLLVILWNERHCYDFTATNLHCQLSSCFSMRPSSTHKVVAYDCERDHTNRKLLNFNLNVMDGMLWSRLGFICIWGVPSLFLMKCKMSGLCVSVHILDCKSYTLIFTFFILLFSLLQSCHTEQGSPCHSTETVFTLLILFANG